MTWSSYLEYKKNHIYICNFIQAYLTIFITTLVRPTANPDFIRRWAIKIRFILTEKYPYPLKYYRNNPNHYFIWEPRSLPREELACTKMSKEDINTLHLYKRKISSFTPLNLTILVFLYNNNNIYAAMCWCMKFMINIT